jgi:ABC-type branched-subunit amino acid transport system substrate-binding protein
VTRILVTRILVTRILVTRILDRNGGYGDVSRRASLRLIALSGAALVGACSSLDPLMRAETPPAPAPQPAPIGSGPVTVALLVPLSAGGGGGAVAAAIRNACDMAMAEFGEGAFQLVVKDDLGTPAGATAAATAALAEGARVILGPLFGPSVAAAGAVARSAGVPVVAFSSDAGVAAPGVYLLSFMPQSDVERIVSYAAQSGKRSYAALIPQTAYGTVVQGEFQASASRNGARIVGMEQFPLDRMAMQEPIARIAGVIKGGQADGLFIPESGDALPLVVQSLTVSGVDPRTIQLLGTGVWEDQRVFADPMLQGGLYAAPDTRGFQAFAAKYKARFNADPVRLASVGYDAVSLVAGLLKTYGQQAFEAGNITNAAGFNGVDGAFRFRADGTNERALAVLRVTPAGGETVSAASRTFA